MYTFLQKARNKILREVYEISFLRDAAQRNYQVALEKHIANLPVLPANDVNLLDTLKREGVVITSLEALGIPSTPKMLEAAKKLMPEIPKSVSGDKNEFVVHASSQQMVENPEVFLWGLEERLLNIVENYIGLPVAYHGAYFRRDIPNDVQIKSRLWHIDKEDRKVLKVIVYFKDVNDDNGPFEYIPQPLTSTVVEALKYKSGYVRDEIMQQVLSSSNWQSCTGLSGTVIFAATGNIFHRGKVPKTSDRFATFFDYTSRRPLQPFYGDYCLPKHHLELLAQNLSEQQRQCIFWQ
jgi:hypothetical protein